MWDLPRPGLEPVSPALAGGLLTTAPPGKSLGSLKDLNHLPKKSNSEKQSMDLPLAIYVGNKGQTLTYRISITFLGVHASSVKLDHNF